MNKRFKKKRPDYNWDQFEQYLMDRRDQKNHQIHQGEKRPDVDADDLTQDIAREKEVRLILRKFRKFREKIEGEGDAE